MRVALGRPARADAGGGAEAAVKTLGSLEMAELSRLKVVLLKKARYYHRDIDLVAQVVSLKATDGEVYLVPCNGHQRRRAAASAQRQRTKEGGRSRLQARVCSKRH